MGLRMHYFHLALAIAFEILGTSALKHAQQFTRLWPSLLVVACYSLAFYQLSLSLRGIPIGIAYAIWSGVGIVCIALVQWLWFREPLDGPALVGIALILIGVVVINGFSKTVGH